MSENGNSVRSGPEVACDAQNCAHWWRGNLCSAAAIEIFNARGPEDPTATGHTACRTFRHRRGLADTLATMDNINWAGMARAPFRGGTQLHPAVRCRVAGCLFWRAGDACGADWIEISGPAATADAETDCATFLPR